MKQVMILAILFSGLASCTKDNGTLPADPVHLTTQLYYNPESNYNDPYLSVELTWKINYSENLIGFIIERSLNNGAYTEITRVSAIDTNFTETLNGRDSAIAYRIRAYNYTGLSRHYSNITSFTKFNSQNLLVGKWKLQHLQIDSNDRKYPNGDSILDEYLIINSNNTFIDSVKLKSYNNLPGSNDWMPLTCDLTTNITQSDSGTHIQYGFTKGYSIEYTSTSLTIYSYSGSSNNFMSEGYVATFQKQ